VTISLAGVVFAYATSGCLFTLANGVVWACNDLERRWRPTLSRALPDVIFTGTTHARVPW
jgi:hypothetical protein